MARLDPARLRSRLAFDWKVLTGLRSSHLGPVRAFASADEARAGRDLSRMQGEAGSATCYQVEYRFPIITGPNQFERATFVWFDLLGGGNYPYTAPVVTCTSQPPPWSPHVNGASGLVCLGDAWPRARGHMLAAQLVVHIMRLLNWDEPDRGAHYSGWTPAAARYWREQLGCRPISPDIDYPILPAELTHAQEDEDTGFRPVASFVARNDESFSAFRRIG